MAINIKFVKDQRIDDVKPVTLKDMGFDYDAPIFDAEKNFSNNILEEFYEKVSNAKEFYGSNMEKRYIYNLLQYDTKEEAFLKLCSDVKYLGVTQYEMKLFLVSRSLFDIDKNLAKKLIEAFVYLIKNIIPRCIQDLFYFVGLDTNGAYWTFFDIAVEYLGLEKYSNHSNNNYGQIKNYPESRIREMILENKSLQEIYDTTCATKTLIKSVIKSMKVKEFNDGQGSKGERLVESILLDLSLIYKREVYFDDFKDVTCADFNGRYDFVIYKYKKPTYVIEFDGEQHFKFIERFHGDIEGFEYQKYKDKIKDLYCEKKELGILRIAYNKVNEAKKLIKDNLINR